MRRLPALCAAGLLVVGFGLAEGLEAAGGMLVLVGAAWLAYEVLEALP